MALPQKLHKRVFGVAFIKKAPELILLALFLSFGSRLHLWMPLADACVDEPMVHLVLVVSITGAFESNT